MTSTARLAAAIVVGLLVAPAAVSATDLAGARAFLVWVYSHYPEPRSISEAQQFDPIGQSSGKVFDAPMISLFRENDRLTPKGDVGALDGDPICDCQDDSGLVVKRLVVSAQGGANATASVDLVFGGGDRQSLRFDLVQVRGHWRVHDIHAKDTPSLRAYLIDANREAARAH